MTNPSHMLPSFLFLFAHYLQISIHNAGPFIHSLSINCSLLLHLISTTGKILMHKKNNIIKSVAQCNQGTTNNIFTAATRPKSLILHVSFNCLVVWTDESLLHFCPNQSTITTKRDRSDIVMAGVGLGGVQAWC